MQVEVEGGRRGECRWREGGEVNAGGGGGSGGEVNAGGGGGRRGECRWRWREGGREGGVNAGGGGGREER